MEEVLPLLIPIIGVSIPLVVVVGKFIVQPLLLTLDKRTEPQDAARDLAPLARRLEATEERLAQLEKSLDRVMEEQDFQGKLLSGESGPPERSYLRRGSS